MEKIVWQLPFHPRLPNGAKAFQCFLRGLRAERADYIRKNESARLIFWRGGVAGCVRKRGESAAPASEGLGVSASAGSLCRFVRDYAFGHPIGSSGPTGYLFGGAAERS